jgi:hypothetical protein
LGTDEARGQDDVALHMGVKQTAPTWMWIDEARLLLSAREVAALGPPPGARFTFASYGHLVSVECKRDGAFVLIDDKTYGMANCPSGPGHRWFLVDSTGHQSFDFTSIAGESGVATSCSFDTGRISVVTTKTRGSSIYEIES